MLLRLKNNNQITNFGLQRHSLLSFKKLPKSTTLKISRNFRTEKVTQCSWAELCLAWLSQRPTSVYCCRVHAWVLPGVRSTVRRSVLGVCVVPKLSVDSVSVGPLLLPQAERNARASTSCFVRIYLTHRKRWVSKVKWWFKKNSDILEAKVLIQCHRNCVKSVV